MSTIKIAGGSGMGLDIAVEPTRSGDGVRKVSHKETADNNHMQANQPANSLANADVGAGSEASKEDEKKLFEAIVEEIRQEVKMDERQVEFSFNPDIRQLMVTVTDKNNGSVVRQIPEEYVLKMIEKFQISGRIEGLLINDKV